MKFGSLFSGIGGFDLALERAGMTCAWQCENDPKASAILKRHWPNVENVGDVHDVRRGRVEAVDLICGGFPCQDLSIAGKRAGLAGKRSGLWFEFARVIDEFEPGWFIVENVPGLLSSDEGKDFAIIIQWMAKRGYGVAWRVLDSQYFGLAQRRRRVFIVGHLGDGCAAEVLFESKGMFGDPPTRRQTGEGIANTFENSIRENNIAQHMISLRSNPAQPVVFQQNTRDEVRLLSGDGSIAGALASEPGMKQQNYLAFNAYQDASNPEENISPTLTHKSDGKSAHSAYNKIGIVNLANSGANQNNVKESEISDTLDTWQTQPVFAKYPMVMAHGQANAEIVKDGEPSLTDNHEAPIVWEMQHASEAYREAGDQSPTLQQRMGTGRNNVPLVGVRRLTPIECERLQGFPDGWTDGQADSSRYRQLGNAISIPPVEWIAKRIYDTQKASCK